jgi:dTDP-4-amino-4,6-dideoxygalactose transaminase
MDSTLAVDGGPAVRTRPMPPWPWYADEVTEAATAVLRSGHLNYWTGGQGRLFEQEFAQYVGRKYAVALANGTVALEAALLALEVGAGDEVIVPSRTFIASASCAVMRGALPVVVDVDSDSQNLTAETIRRAMTPRTKAIIAVHLAGWPCDMDPILELAREHGIKVIEDCAQCHGARYRQRMTGSLADVAAFSFCQDKIMTSCGEGGMLVTDDPCAFERAWSFKDHGKNYHAATNLAGPRAFRWLHDSFGTNWRLTEVQSAVGRVLLRRLDKDVAARRRNAAILIEGLRRIPALRVPIPGPDIQHAYYKFYAFVRPELLNEVWTRDRILTAINAEGVPCFSGTCSEIYRELAFANLASHGQFLPIAKRLGETSLMFLVHPTLTEQDMLDTCQAIKKVLSVAARVTAAPAAA